MKLFAYTGKRIQVVGECNWTVKYKNKSYTLEFIVVKPEAMPILGLNACEYMGLIKRVHALEKSTKIDTGYADVFEGLGCLAGEHSIRIDENVTPKVPPPRKIAVTQRKTENRTGKDGKIGDDNKD